MSVAPSEGRWPAAPAPGSWTADAASVVAVTSLVVSLWFGPAAVMLLLLVAGGVVLTRWSRLPGAMQACTVLGMTGAAWAGVLGGYEAVGWLDLVTHLALTGLLAVLAVAVLERLGWIRLLPTGVPRQQAGATIVVLGLGLTCSVLWELGEWAGNRFVDEGLHVGYVDTLGDLAAGGLGACIAGAAWARWAAGRS